MAMETKKNNYSSNLRHRKIKRNIQICRYIQNILITASEEACQWSSVLPGRYEPEQSVQADTPCGP